MLKKFLYFIGGWVIAVLVLNKLVFKLMLEFVRNEGAVAAICIICVIVVTVVWGTIVGTTK